MTVQRRWGRLRWLGGLVLWLVVALLAGFVLALSTGAGLPGKPEVLLVVGVVVVFLIRWLWR